MADRLEEREISRAFFPMGACCAGGGLLALKKPCSSLLNIRSSLSVRSSLIVFISGSVVGSSDFLRKSFSFLASLPICLPKSVIKGNVASDLDMRLS